jgi:hypothetical protein
MKTSAGGHGSESARQGSPGYVDLRGVSFCGANIDLGADQPVSATEPFETTPEVVRQPQS